VLGTIALAGFTAGFLLLFIANYIIMKGKSAQAGLKDLPFIHATMLVYAMSIILDSIFRRF